MEYKLIASGFINLPKIAILVPYFGKWPFWFNYFLKSCEPNKDYRWFFYTDCESPENPPENTSFFNISFDDYKKLLSKKLNINFDPSSPYKLCDIKPALGFIHESDIKGYEFFGYSDIDIICGNLNVFFTREKRNKYDIISSHYRRLSGHFCLLRNTLEIRELFLKAKTWKEEFENQNHTAFDEKSFSDLFVKHKNFPPSLRRITNKLYNLTRKVSFEEAYSTPNTRPLWHDGTRNYPDTWLYKNGKLNNNLDGDREFPYLHFLYWKNDVWPKSQELLPPPEKEEWLISSQGFT
ncbi:DUF6625 family protein [Endozoicomonas sp. 2B-B]